jgi:hypothetical protein
MALLSGQSSLWDERYWRLDSGFRSSSYRIEIGAISYGKVCGSDLEHKVQMHTENRRSRRLTKKISDDLETVAGFKSAPVQEECHQSSLT